LKTVEITEELKYYTPGEPACCKEEEECFDLYNVCNCGCGKMEYVGEGPSCAKEKDPCCCEPGSGGSDNTCGKPVTYTRKQQFHFKNKEEPAGDTDGPPFAWPYDQGKSG
jgi:hypothetical protein